MQYCKNESKDSKIYTALFLAVFAYPIITLFINTIVNLIYPNTPLDTMLCMGIYTLIILAAIPVIIRRLNYTDFLIYFIAILFVLINSFLYGNFSVLKQYIFKIIFNVLPFYFIGKSMREENFICDNLFSLSRICIVLASIIYLLKINTNNITASNNDNMSFAYYFLPFSILSFFSFLTDKKWYDFIFLATSLIVQFLAGTRGPIFCLGIAVFVFVFFQNKNKKIKILVLSAILICLLVYFSPLFTIIIDNLSELFSKYNINSRILEFIKSKDIFNATGRDTIKDSLMDAMNGRWFWGIGIMGDRKLLGIYVHNLFLELLADFGIIFGLLFIIIIFIIIIKSIYVHRNNIILLSLLLALGFFKLFLSGSYTVEPYFFMLLGYCLNKKYNSHITLQKDYNENN